MIFNAESKIRINRIFENYRGNVYNFPKVTSLSSFISTFQYTFLSVF